MRKEKREVREENGEEKGMGLALRPATFEDRSRILEIAAQIWEGDDYVPHVIDRWLTDTDAELSVVVLEGEVVGFARFSWLLPGYAWFEGLRVDPARRNLGAAKQVTRYFLERARQGHARQIGLSTYIENHASLHIIETHGFEKVAEFVYVEEAADAPLRQHAVPCADAVDVSPDEAVEFIRASQFLRVARGYIPHGWKFYPFEWDPLAILSHMRLILGIRWHGQLTALLCAGHLLREQGEFTVDFIDGEREDVACLLRHALYLAQDSRTFEMMVPKTGEDEAAVLDVLRSLDAQPWHEFKADVLVYRQ